MGRPGLQRRPAAARGQQRPGAPAMSRPRQKRRVKKKHQTSHKQNPRAFSFIFSVTDWQLPSPGWKLRKPSVDSHLVLHCLNLEKLCYLYPLIFNCPLLLPIPTFIIWSSLIVANFWFYLLTLLFRRSFLTDDYFSFTFNWNSVFAQRIWRDSTGM